jgi:hemoglobin-like flavoprotein
MPLDIDNLETSFDAIAPRGDEFVEKFYERFFVHAPEAKKLFPADMTNQRAMALSVLVLLRKSLRNLERVVPTLRDLGYRHVAYGTLPEHYPPAGVALIEAMTEIAGDAWRPEYERAWIDAWAVIAGTMMDGAAQAVADQRLAA